MGDPGAVLITGGGSGIGAGLAASFHSRGMKVVVVGQRRESAESVAGALPGIAFEVVDVTTSSRGSARAQGRGALARPVDGCEQGRRAGPFDFLPHEPLDPAAFWREVDVNLKGVLHVANASLPILRRQTKARLVNVGSGLGYAPLVSAPVYSATEAAVHSFTISLRRQLAETSVQIVELIPPVVTTGFHRNLDKEPPNAMPLEAFVKATMAGLDAGRDEIVVGLANALRILARVAPAIGLKLINSGERTKTTRQA